MNAPIYCITGKARQKEGVLCLECNGFHHKEDEGVPPLRISVRTVAHMLHDDEISPRDAALTLFLLTEDSHRHIVSRRD